MAGFGSAEAVPQGMQRLIGFAAPPRQKESDASAESFGDKLEQSQSQSAPAATRRDQ